MLVPCEHFRSAKFRLKYIFANLPILTLILPIYLNFYPPEVVSRYRDPQLQGIRKEHSAEYSDSPDKDHLIKNFNH